MRLVLDTGIFVSALITKGTPPDLLYQAWRRDHLYILVTSDYQINEIRRVFSYPKLDRFLNA